MAKRKPLVVGKLCVACGKPATRRVSHAPRRGGRKLRDYAVCNTCRMRVYYGSSLWKPRGVQAVERYERALKIDNMLGAGFSKAEIARSLGVCYHTVHRASSYLL